MGITPADDFTDYIDIIKSRGDAYDFFDFTSTNPLVDARPRDKMPEAKSIIVLVWDYYQYEFPDELKNMIGKIYMSRSYNSHKGTVAKSRLNLMSDYLTQNGCDVNTRIGMPARLAAARAGIANIGRNTFAYTEDSGSYIVIYTMVVDKVLEYDSPTFENNCPPECSACIKACPTQAITEPFKLNPKRCIGFNNWATQDGRGKISSFIPYDIRDSMGCKIHGCDICQDVCPRNKAKINTKKPMDDFVEFIGKDITLSNILNISDELYEKRIKPIMYNYIKDTRYFRRNAIIAMGNSGKSEYLPELRNVLDDPDDMIREYAQWALEKLEEGDVNAYD